MSDAYDMMIDSLIQSTEEKKLETMKSKEIVLQLQGFLNIQFNDEKMHYLKRKVHRKIRHYLQQCKREHELIEEANKQSIDDLLFPFISAKIFYKIWIELLYNNNIGTFEKEIISDSLQEVKETKTKQNTIPQPSIQPQYEPRHGMVRKLLRDNMSLLTSIDHHLDISNYNISNKEQRQIMKPVFKRRKKYFQEQELQEQIKRSTTVTNRVMYNWDKDMQDFLNIYSPLTIGEVFHMVWRYIHYLRRMNNGKLIPDSRMEFFFKDKDCQKLTRNDYFGLVAKHRLETEGFVQYDGLRFDSDGSLIPVEKYNISSEKLNEAIEKAKKDMNVPKEFTKMLKFKDRIKKRRVINKVDNDTPSESEQL